MVIKGEGERSNPQILVLGTEKNANKAIEGLNAFCTESVSTADEEIHIPVEEAHVSKVAKAIIKRYGAEMEGLVHVVDGLEMGKLQLSAKTIILCGTTDGVNKVRTYFILYRNP